MRRFKNFVTLALSLAFLPPAISQTRTFVAYVGSYSSGTVYNLNDMVSSGSVFYISLVANNVNYPPSSSAAEWAPVSTGTGAVGPAGGTGATGPVGPLGPAGPVGANGVAGVTGPPGLNWLGAWSNATDYVVTDAVSYEGASYMATQASSNQNPATAGLYWSLLAQEGATGPTGATGAQGAQGIQGPAGAVGPAGANGLTGPMGPSGTTGFTGAMGPAGAVGPIGPAGAASTIPGPAGPVGPAGATGPTGTTGAQGAQGIQGPTGAAGPAGANGLTGPMGPSGTTGFTGAMGPAGPMGQIGPAGTASTIPGPAGPVGPAGTTGLTGATGAQGIQGVQGPAGAAGLTGPMGPVGPAGAASTVPGPPGAAGSPGPNGTASVNQVQPLIGNQLPTMRNLFDVAQMAGNYNWTLDSGSGAVSNSYCPGCGVSGLMPVTPGGSVTVNAPGGSGWINYVFYDIAGAYISGASFSSSAGPNTLSVPPNAAALRVGFHDFGADAAVMVVNGTTLPSTYQSFGYLDPQTTANQIAAAVAPFSSTAAALAQAGAGLPTVRNLFDPSQVAVNQGIVPTTGILSGVGWPMFATGFIAVQPGGQISLSDAVNLTNDGAYGSTDGYAFYTLSQTFISGGQFTTNPQTLRVPSNAAYFRASFNSYGADESTLMIVNGPTLPATYQAFGYLTPDVAAANIAAALAAQHTADLTRLLPMNGAVIGVLGDSISSIFGNGWQNVVLARTGATLGFQDARPGRGIGGLFECYAGVAGTSIGTFDVSNSVGNCTVYGDTGQTTGHTLAQDLATVQMLIVEEGTNDMADFPTHMGTPGDAIGAGTFYGNMRWVIETLLSANHTMHIVWIGPQDNAEGTHAQMEGIVAAEAAECATYGIPYLNLSAVGGGSSFNGGWYTQGDYVHPSAYTFAHFYGPIVAQFVQQYF